ncbi:MAG: right-handed parallel beta-helix repeat-containing protein [Polyangiales bacterium]
MPSRARSVLTALVPLFALSLASRAAHATEYRADPSTFTAMLPMLRAGDTLALAAGRYTRPLNITNLNATAASPIVITGPASGDPAVFVADPGACCNTIELRNSSYVTIQRLTVDGNHVDGVFGLSAKDGMANNVHHITVQDNTFTNHDGSQQTVAISTKTPTWGWIIRRNRILSPGTGMYLGNSDGTSPFVEGIIENNLIENSIGYCMQIKWQAPWPAIMGLPSGSTATLIRHNVFIKNDRPSPDGARPNVLVGGFPASGNGSMNRYEIYGNLFVHNSTAAEGLLQASGRVSVHHNIFVDAAGHAILVANHDRPLLRAWIYDNTIYSTATGIRVGTAPEGIIVTGNAIFSNTAIAGTPTMMRENLTDSVANAAMHVTAPAVTLGSMDFYPKPGRCQGPANDHSTFAMDQDFNRDFNGTDATPFRFRGAYAGEGANSGWRLAADIKGTMSAPPIMDGGTAPADASVTPTDSGTIAPSADSSLPAQDATSSDGGNTTPMPAGCACRAPSRAPSSPRSMLALVALVCAAAAPRKRPHHKSSHR